jgi:hypothetical protein
VKYRSRCEDQERRVEALHRVEAGERGPLPQRRPDDHDNYHRADHHDDDRHGADDHDHYDVDDHDDPLRIAEPRLPRGSCRPARVALPTAGTLRPGRALPEVHVLARTTLRGL